LRKRLGLPALCAPACAAARLTARDAAQLTISTRRCFGRKGKDKRDEAKRAQKTTGTSSFCGNGRRHLTNHPRTSYGALARQTTNQSKGFAVCEQYASGLLRL